MEERSNLLGMKAAHRKCIENYIELLVDLTNYEELALACVQHKLLSERMLQVIEELEEQHMSQSADVIRRSIHTKLIRKITHRGPSAYKLFIEVLVQIKAFEAVRLLRKYK